MQYIKWALCTAVAAVVIFIGGQILMVGALIGAILTGLSTAAFLIYCLANILMEYFRSD